MRWVAQSFPPALSIGCNTRRKLEDLPSDPGRKRLAICGYGVTFLTRVRRIQGR